MSVVYPIREDRGPRCRNFLKASRAGPTADTGPGSYLPCASHPIALPGDRTMVGLIASIGRILVITLEAATLTKGETSGKNMRTAANPARRNSASTANPLAPSHDRNFQGGRWSILI